MADYNTSMFIILLIIVSGMAVVCYLIWQYRRGMTPFMINVHTPTHGISHQNHIEKVEEDVEYWDYLMEKFH